MFITGRSRLKRRFLIFGFILVLLSGCGQLQPASYSQKTPVSGHSGNTTPIPTSSGPISLGKSIAFDLDGWLHVQSPGGFTCSFSNVGSVFPGTLILPTVQPTYDQGTLQLAKNYVSTVVSQVMNAGQPDIVPYPSFSASPNVFQLVPVSAALPGCNEVLLITNIGKSPVQISQVSVQFTTNTQTNNHHYDLIDACSLSLNLASGCPPVGHGGGAGVYQAQFDLHSGKTSTIMPATCWGYGAYNCSPKAPMLQPGEVIKVYLEYFSHTSNNLSFSLLPSFTLDWPGKQANYPVLQLQETFAFAAKSQFSCYRLLNQQFLESSINFSHWCI